MHKIQLIKAVQLLIVLMSCTLSAQTTPTEIDSFSDQVLCTNDPITYNAEIHKTAFLDFNKADGRHVVLNSLADDLAATNRSAFMWVKKHTDVARDFQSLFAINTSDGKKVISDIRIGTNEKVGVYHGGNTIETPNSTALDNEWHYVGYTYNNTSTETIIYIDGAAAKTFTNNQATTSTDLYSLGQRHFNNLNPDKFFDGYLAEVTIWDEVLDATDIATAMGNKVDTSHPKYSNLVGYYSFSENDQDTSILKDHSSKVNDGTIIGSIIDIPNNIDEIPNFNAANWYTLSWQKNNTEFSALTSVNITPDNTADAYKLSFVNPIASYEDFWDLSYTVLLPTQPDAITSAVGGNATFEVDQIPGATYQWHKKGKNLEKINSAQDLGAEDLGSRVRMAYNDNGIYYAVLEGEGLYKSTDKGENWTNIANGTMPNFKETGITDLFVDGQNIYTANNRFSFSSNGGETWTSVGALERGYKGSKPTSIAGSGNYIYVGSHSGLHISSNNGNRFINLDANDLGAGTGAVLVNKIKVSGNNVYVGLSPGTLSGSSSSGGVAISNDNGVSWSFTDTEAILGDPTLFDVEYNDQVLPLYVEGNVIYTAIGYTALKSTDNGANWTVLGTFGRDRPSEIYVNGNQVVILNFQAINISYDYGKNFITTMYFKLNLGIIGTVDLRNFNRGFIDDGKAFFGLNIAINSTVAEGALFVYQYDLAITNDAEASTNSNKIEGATTNKLTISNLTLDENDAEYYVVVSKEGCEQTSEAVTLKVVVAPRIVSKIPTNNSTGIAVDSDIEITFNEPITKGTGNISIKNSSDDSVVETISVASAAVTIDANTLIINPTNFDFTTTYYVELEAGIVTGNETSTPNLAITGKGTSSFITDGDVIGIKTIDTIELSISPNPTSSTITVNTNDKIDGIVLFNSIGSEVLRSDTINLNLSELPAGIYFLQIQLGSKTVTKKVVKL
jgi:hypothetical protein